jgi:hypothetical protein
VISSVDMDGEIVRPLTWMAELFGLYEVWCYSAVGILPSFSHDTCHIHFILLSYLMSDKGVPPCLVYGSSNQPEVAGMMQYFLSSHMDGEMSAVVFKHDFHLQYIMNSES